MNTISASCHINASLSSLATARQFVVDCLAQLQPALDREIVEDMVFGVNEIATNMIHHGYKDQGGAIDIQVNVSEGVLRVSLRDQCSHFDPNHAPAPDLNLALEQRPLGKVGLYLTQTYMDEVQHHPLLPQGNEVTLIKYLKGD